MHVCVCVRVSMYVCVFYVDSMPATYPMEFFSLSRFAAFGYTQLQALWRIVGTRVYLPHEKGPFSLNTRRNIVKTCVCARVKESVHQFTSNKKFFFFVLFVAFSYDRKRERETHTHTHTHRSVLQRVFLRIIS